MNLTEKEQNILIKLLEEELELNPYNKENKDLLEKLKKQTMFKINNVRNKREKNIRNGAENRANKVTQNENIDEFARTLIKYFYKAGVLPSIDGSGTTNDDIKATREYFNLCLKLDENIKKLYNIIKEKNIDSYEEFKEIIDRYDDEFITIINKLRKIVRKQQIDFRRRIKI